MKTATSFFVFLCLILCQTFAQSQDQKPWLEVIENNKSEILSHELEKLDRLVSKGVYENYWIVSVLDLESSINNDELNINIPDRTFNAKFRKSWVGGSGSGQSIWEGKDYSGSGYALIMLDDGLIFGHFRSQGEDYILYNMEESKASVLVKQNKNYFLVLLSHFSLYRSKSAFLC